jgi:hypothetical protein
MILWSFSVNNKSPKFKKCQTTKNITQIMKRLSKAVVLNWTTAEVRRWLENEGYADFWSFVEADAPFTGQDLLCLSADDWHRIFQDHTTKSGPKKPSVVRIRRLCTAVSRLKAPPALTNGYQKSAADNPDDVDSSEDEDDDLDESPAPSSKSCPVCNSLKIKRGPVDIKPERWKTLLAFSYVLVVSWITAFVMVIVHDRVPDMDKYPPLPDIILDNIPHIPWAFEMCELTGMFSHIGSNHVVVRVSASQ